MSAYLAIVDDEDLGKDNPQWKASEWIGCGREFTDVPGLNRKARTEQPEAEVGNAASNGAGGNAANAAAAAGVRASTAIRRPWDSVTYENFRILPPFWAQKRAKMRGTGRDLWISVLLARVITLYARGGGKAGKHDYVASVDSIGRVSYALLQTFAYSGGGRTFQRLHSSTGNLGISRFAHLPSGSILLRLPDKVNPKQHLVEISSAMTLKYKELQKEKGGLIRAVIALNTVQRQGQASISAIDLEDDDDEEG
ncbi:hypothetical protein R3P38DRAFT_2778869 [Favolaschia claudopus]|uniref:Uncharacterized protein n=1 Tax=Favolaschia claudopus TaxID=2862362 RepID=A0AAW0BG69_9AGAR